jgi:HEAT repeat protein
VERLRNYLNSYHSETQPFALASVVTSLGQIRDPRARQALEELSDSKFVAVRLGAMDALRWLKSRESIPVLVKRLGDPSNDVQYLAVVSLSEALGMDEEYRPTMNLFDKKPQYYVGLWKQWWADEGIRLHLRE